MPAVVSEGDVAVVAVCVADVVGFVTSALVGPATVSATLGDVAGADAGADALDGPLFWLELLHPAATMATAMQAAVIEVRLAAMEIPRLWTNGATVAVTARDV